MNNQEQRILFTSDTHFCHNKEFLFGDRNFLCPEDMNKEIIKRWNDIVRPNDIVYHLGDIVLSDTDAGIECIKQLNGTIHLIRGNHDTDVKIERFINECPNIVSIEWATMIKYRKIHFYLSHFPSITRNLDDKPNKQGIINLHGHTHQKTNFIDDNNPYVYHVGMDSHNLTPILFDDIIEEITKKKEFLLNNRKEDNNGED